MARVLSLHNAGLSWPPGIDGKSAPKVYGFALKGLPGEALKRAVTKIIRGELAAITKFMPTPPQLAAMVRAEARPLVEARARARETLDAYGRRAPDPEKSADAIDRIRKMVAGVKMAAQEARDSSGRGIRPEDPMTPEQAERARLMMALPDAPEITAEQLAYRRKVQKRVEESGGDAAVSADVGLGRDFEGEDAE